MIDSTNVAFSSTWDIDQLIFENITHCPIGTTAVYTFSGSDIPVIDVQFVRDAGSSYYNPGTNSSANTLATLFTWYSYILNNTLYVVTTEVGSAHYMVMEDKINY